MGLFGRPISEAQGLKKSEVGVWAPVFRKRVLGFCNPRLQQCKDIVEVLALVSPLPFTWQFSLSFLSRLVSRLFLPLLSFFAIFATFSPLLVTSQILRYVLRSLRSYVSYPPHAASTILPRPMMFP